VKKQVLLELGGKCPCIIDNELNGKAVDIAVQRITWFVLCVCLKNFCFLHSFQIVLTNEGANI
jgi:hypothetical protein